MYFIPLCTEGVFIPGPHTHRDTDVLVWLRLWGAALQFKSISFCLVRAFCADNTRDCSGVYVCGPHVTPTHRAVVKGARCVMVGGTLYMH